MNTELNTKNFSLHIVQGVGRNDTKWTGLEVVSKNAAEKHCVEVRLDSDDPDLNGGSVQYKYHGVHVAHGMRMGKDTLDETLELADVLKEAVEFARNVKAWIDNNPQWK